MPKLSHGQKHVMKLISRDKDKDGWTPLSNTIYKHLKNDMPAELITLSGTEDDYKVKLTPEGENVLAAAVWLE